jgi:hypothetical protein
LNIGNIHFLQRQFKRMVVIPSRLDIGNDGLLVAEPFSAAAGVS